MAELQLAYARRLRWEARLYAREVVVALSAALGSGDGYRRGASGKRYRQVTAEEALGLG